MKLLRNSVLFQLTFILLIPLSNLGATTTIAVMDFIPKGVTDVEASALTDRLRTELVRIGKYDIVEREMMNILLAEQGFQMTGCTDQKCIVAAGQILNAAQIIAGSIGRVGRIYTVSARMVDVETGRVVQTATFDHEGSIEELLRSGMKRVAAALSGDILPQPEVKDQDQRDIERDLMQPVENTDGDRHGQLDEAEGGAFESRSSRIFGTWSLNRPKYSANSSSGYGGSFSIGYSRILGDDFELGIEVMFVGISLRDDYIGQHNLLMYVQCDGWETGLLLRANYWLDVNERISISPLMGIGGVRWNIRSNAQNLLGEITTNVDDWYYSAFLWMPVGFSIGIINTSRIMFITDIGYIITNRKELSNSAYESHGDYEGLPVPSISPSGPFISLRFQIKI